MVAAPSREASEISLRALEMNLGPSKIDLQLWEIHFPARGIDLGAWKIYPRPSKIYPRASKIYPGVAKINLGLPKIILEDLQKPPGSPQIILEEGVTGGYSSERPSGPSTGMSSGWIHSTRPSRHTAIGFPACLCRSSASRTARCIIFAMRYGSKVPFDSRQLVGIGVPAGLFPPVLTGLRGESSEPILGADEGLVPVLLVPDFLEDQDSDRILLVRGELLERLHCLFKESSHLCAPCREAA